jgi:hypothetical protein
MDDVKEMSLKVGQKEGGGNNEKWRLKGCCPGGVVKEKKSPG